MMEKAIYGLAMPFNDCYVKTPKNDNDPFVVERTSRESVYFDEMVGITLQHDFSKGMGKTGDNLTVKVTENGVYFKLVPNSLLGHAAYKKVKRCALRHCSLSFFIPRKQKNEKMETMVSDSLRYWSVTDPVVVEDYKKIIIYEICLTNGPANKSTFCTTDKNDERLNGIDWGGDPLPIDMVCNTDVHAYKRSLMEYVEISEKYIESLGR